jgi:hypothetical protein
MYLVGSILHKFVKNTHICEKILQISENCVWWNRHQLSTLAWVRHLQCSCQGSIIVSGFYHPNICSYFIQEPIPVLHLDVEFCIAEWQILAAVIVPNSSKRQLPYCLPNIHIFDLICIYIINPPDIPQQALGDNKHGMVIVRFGFGYIC